MEWLLPETDGFAIGLRLFIDFLGVMAAVATGDRFASSWSPLWLVVARDARACGGGAFSALRAVSGDAAVAPTIMA